MDIKSYQDLEVWQKAMDLVMECYQMTKTFPKSETYSRPLIPDPCNKGFSLVELLIAMVIASVVGIAGISIFSSSNWSYKTQEDITEAQQNVRVAADRLAKDIRMAGYGLPDPPFSISFTGLSATPTALPNPLTSPITVTNNSTGFDTITILGIGYEAGILKSAGVCTNGSGTNVICMNTDSFFSGAAYQSTRRYISLNGTTFIELSSAAGDHVNAAEGSMKLSSPAILDRTYPDGTPVYIIQAVNYSIDTDTTLAGCSPTNPCLVSRDYAMIMGGTAPGGRQVLAENIEDIQFAYGIDVSPRDGKIDYTAPYAATAFQDNPTDPSSIIAVRANIVGRTRNQDMKGQTGFKAQCFEDRTADAGTTNCTGAPPDGFRRRVLTKVIKIRNPKTGA